MLKKLLVDHGSDLAVLIFFFFSFSVFLYVILRTFLMKRPQVEAEANLPFSDEAKPPTPSSHEQP